MIKIKPNIVLNARRFYVLSEIPEILVKHILVLLLLNILCGKMH